MLTFKCKMCGGDIPAADGATFGTCESCGTTSTLPKAGDEKIVNLFNRANHFRRLNEFDKALSAYENILNEAGANAEAHWCAALCRHGIEYVEDPRTHERIPTCHRAQYASILTDADYLAALENATDGYTRGLYENEAKKINEIQKGILAISSREEPYDVFICYKETTDGGSRTKDSTIAQDIYYQLKNEYRVFFAKITLEDKLGREYEPYIFSALNSAKVMLVIGTKKEYFEAVWVKNEWSRFLALAKTNRSRVLIPCYRDMDPYDLPDELAMLQSQDMSKIGFMQDLIRGVKKTLDAEKSALTANAQNVASNTALQNIEPLMKRGYLFLEDGDWKQADDYFDRVLDMNPEYAPAYIGKLCAGLCLSKEEELALREETLSDYKLFQKALRFADANYRTKLENYNREVLEKSSERRRKRLADEAERKKKYLAEIRKPINKFKVCISAGGDHKLGLSKDGTVYVDGLNLNERVKILQWYDIVAVAAGSRHSVGLKADGTVVSSGNNEKGQCNTNEWKDIIEISAGYGITAGLRKDGTVVAVGANGSGQCETQNWNDIVSISAGDYHIIGLKSDGTVVAVGDNEYGQCNLGGVNNVVMVSAGAGFSVVLKADGTVGACGRNVCGQCNVNQWQEIIMVAAGREHTAGLTTEGRVIIAHHYINPKARGKVLDDDRKRYDVSDWQNICAISARYITTIGLTTNGEIVSVGERRYIGGKGIGFVTEEKLQEAGKLREQERLKREQYDRWNKQGLCTKCGGQLGGLIMKKCKSCGEEYDDYWTDRIDRFGDRVGDRIEKFFDNIG